MSQGEGGGRPPVYTAERIADIQEKLITWSRREDALYLASFCAENDLWPQRLSELSDVNDMFSEALKMARAKCESRLAQKTGDGKMVASFGIFALKQHKWTDRTETEISGPDKGPVRFEGFRIELVNPPKPVDAE